MAADRIIIKDLLLRGTVGVNDWERREKQDILINLELSADLRPAGRSDRVEDSVNYRTVSKEVIKLVESASRFTVEALAEDIAGLCLRVPGVTTARVRVEKPGAVRFAASAGVEIHRSDEHPGL